MLICKSKNVICVSRKNGPPLARSLKRKTHLAGSQYVTRGSATPEVLVSTEWLPEHLEDPSIRIVESNEDQLLYKAGHIPGAVEVVHLGGTVEAGAHEDLVLDLAHNAE